MHDIYNKEGASIQMCWRDNSEKLENVTRRIFNITQLLYGIKTNNSEQQQRITKPSLYFLRICIKSTSDSTDNDASDGWNGVAQICLRLLRLATTIPLPFIQHQKPSRREERSVPAQRMLVGLLPTKISYANLQEVQRRGTFAEGLFVAKRLQLSSKKCTSKG